VRAYENGARALEGTTEDVAAGRLRELAGTGEALAKKIAYLHATGTTELLDRLRAKHPPGTLELLQVPELGPKKAAALRRARAPSGPYARRSLTVGDPRGDCPTGLARSPFTDAALRGWRPVRPLVHRQRQRERIPGQLSQEVSHAELA